MIATTAQLNLLASRVNGGNSYAGVYFQLTKDLAYSGTNNYTAIGTAEHPFCGSFDGRGFAVSGINGADALFGTIGTSGQVTNLLWLDPTPAKAYLDANSYADVYTITSGTQGLNVGLRSGMAIAHGSAIYAPAGAEIGITLSLAHDGGVLGEVQMNAVTLAGSGADRTLTMPNGNAVITATLSNTWTGDGTANDDPATVPTNNLHGVDIRTEKSALGEGTFYVMGMVGDDFGFFEYKGAYMPARKAYLLVSGAQTARGLTMVFDGEETGLSDLTPDPSRGGEGSSYWYTIDGRRLDAKPTKSGVYVNNGRKVVIR